MAAGGAVQDTAMSRRDEGGEYVRSREGQYGSGQLHARSRLSKG